MGRNRKKGLDFFDDQRVDGLINTHGGESVAVYMFIMCYISKKGDGMKYYDDFPFDVAEKLRLEESYVKDVLKSLVQTGLLNTEMYKEGILCGPEIPKRIKIWQDQLSRV